MRYVLTSPDGKKYVVTSPKSVTDTVTPAVTKPVTSYAKPTDERTVTQPLESQPFREARKAPDGHWYVPDSSRPGKYLRVIRAA